MYTDVVLDLRNAEVKRLLQAVQETRAHYTVVAEKYGKALDVAIDTSYSSDGAAGLRIVMDEYKRALDRYSEAVRALATYLQREQ